MLNPDLEKSLYSLPVQPILIEVDPARFSETMSQILNLFTPGLPTAKLLTQTIQHFSIAALAPVSPDLIRKVNNLPGVQWVHADLVARAINQIPYPGDTLPVTQSGLRREPPVIVSRGGAEQPFTAPAKPAVPSALTQANWWPTSESRKVLGADLANQQGYSGETSRVGVCDTGVDVAHEQVVGTEFYTTMTWPDREIFDEVGHGTHVISTIAGKPENTPAGLQVEGLSKAHIISVKCLGRGIGTGFNSEIINAMATCVQKGAIVISMSLGGSAPQGGIENDPMCKAVKYLTGQGVIFCIAAGNSGPNSNTIGTPGCAPEAITVAAINMDGTVADFSSRGGSQFPLKPDVAAPGVLIYSGTSRISPMGVEQPQAGYGYVAISGTSMATPHVAGLVALLKQKFPNMTAEDFKGIMRSKGKTFDYNTGYGVPNWQMFIS